MEQLMDGPLGAVVIVAGVIVAVLLALIATVRNLIVIVPPNLAAVITGRRRDRGDGSMVGYRSVIGGRTLRVPIIEKVDFLPLETVKMEVNVRNAFSKGGIPLDVDAVANVKIASEPESVFNNAVERLLGKSEAELMTLAQETLMGNLRGVLATLTPEEVNEDRLTFAQRLTEEAADDLNQLGFRLDVLKIQNVSDEVGYLDAIGRAQTAEILKQAQVAEAERDAETRQKQAEARQRAEIAEADATAAVSEQQADARRRADVAAARANVSIAEAQNELRVRQAALDREAETAEKVAVVEAQRAEVEAQKLLQERRVEMTRERLRAEVIEPAEAAEKAAQADARAQAAPILERGKANVQVLELLYRQLQAGGPDAFAAMVMEKMPQLFATAVEAVKGIEIDRLTVSDSNGDAMGQAASSKVNAAMAVLENVSSSFGVDLQQVLQRAAGQERKMELPAVPAPEAAPAP